MTSRKTLNKDESAQVGIGTMIVFIATVLVAAVAAGVLINVSGDLQSQATATGNDATDNVATSLSVDRVIGDDAGQDGTINTVDIYIRLGAGSEAVPLDKVVIHRSNGATFATSAWEDATAPAADNFVSVSANGNLDATPDKDKLLERGDYIVLRMDLTGEEWTPNQEVTLQIVPSVGNPVSIEFPTPPNFTTQSVRLFG